MQRVLCLATALLTTSLCAMSAEWEKPVPTDCSLGNGGKFYLYNATMEQFASDVSGQVSLADEGSLITFVQLKSGDWTLESEKGYWYSDLDYVGCDGALGEGNSNWYVEKEASGAYHLRASKNDIDFSWELYPDAWMGFSWEKWKLTSLIKADEGTIDWSVISGDDYAFFASKVTLHHTMKELQGYGYDVTKLLTVYNSATEKATIDEALKGVQDDLNNLRIEHASEENPVDVTSIYMRNPDFTENWVNDGHDVPVWTMVPATFCGMGESDNVGFYPYNKTIGSWSGGAFGDNKVSQQLTGLKNGKYKLGNYGLWIRHTGEDGDPLKGAYIYAKVGD